MITIGLRGETVKEQELITGRSCVIGISGSGKSYLIAVICEELCRNNHGFCIIDTEGEYSSIKEKFNVLWAGFNDSYDVNLGNLDLDSFCKTIISENVAVIIDLSESFSPNEFLNDYLTSLYKASSQLRRPYLLIVEEADKFIPQSRKEVIPIIGDISRRGRKRGLGLMLATQRPALVNKNVLSQCSNQFIGRLSISNDIDSVKIFFNNKKDLYKLPDLERGMFFVMGNISKEESLIKIRKRITPHKALTPRVESNLPADLSRIIKKFKESDFKVHESFLSVNPLISKEEAVSIFEKELKKKYLFFGPPAESVKNVRMVFYPLLRIVLRIITSGFKGRKFHNISLLFDSQNFIKVSLKKGLEFKEDLSRLIGLNENQILICIDLLMSKKPLSINEISRDLGLSDSTVRKELREMEGGLVSRTIKKGNENYYTMLYDIKIPELSKSAEFKADVLSLPGRRLKPKIEVNDVKTVIKSLVPNSEIIKAETIYYPLWTCIVSNSGDERIIIIDAVTKSRINISLP